MKKIATGNVNFRGAFKKPNGEEHVIETSHDVVPWAERPTEKDSWIFSGEVVGGSTFQIGGTPTQSKSGKYDRLKPYKFGDGGWANVVELPPGTKFTCEVASWGSPESEAVIRVFIHDNEDTLANLEKQYRIAQIEAQYNNDR